MATRKSSESRTEKKPPERVTSRDYPLEESIGFLVSVTNRKLQRLLEAKIAGSGVTSGTWHFMRVLWQADGMSQADLASRANTSAPTVNAALRKLQAAGLVVLTDHPHDGRRWNVHLTRKGRELEEKLLPRMRDLNKRLSSSLTPKDLSELRRMLQVLQDNSDSEMRE